MSTRKAKEAETKGTMTAAQFEALRPRLKRVTVATLDIARRVLVDGMSLAGAAQEAGVTRQRVKSMVERVERAASDVPADWVHVEVWLPPDLAEKVEALRMQAVARLKNRAEAG